MGTVVPIEAQRVLSLDSCRALALRNNKQLNVSKLKDQISAKGRRIWCLSVYKPGNFSLKQRAEECPEQLRLKRRWADQQ